MATKALLCYVSMIFNIQVTDCTAGLVLFPERIVRGTEALE